MTKAKLQIVSDQDPARAELAAAIAAAAEARKASSVAEEAVIRARRMVSDAEAKLQTASAAVADAKEAQAARVLSAAKAGTEISSDASMREARARETVAADDLDAARSVLATLEGAVADPSERLQRAQQRIERAADAVIATAPIAQMVAEATRMQRELIDRRLVLSDLLFKGLLPDHHKGAVSDLLHSCTLPGGIGDIQYGDFDESALEPWRAARAALLLDANAPLPE